MVPPQNGHSADPETAASLNGMSKLDSLQTASRSCPPFGCMGLNCRFANLAIREKPDRRHRTLSAQLPAQRLNALSLQ
jgi:hypothetical protein